MTSNTGFGRGVLKCGNWANKKPLFKIKKRDRLPFIAITADENLIE